MQYSKLVETSSAGDYKDIISRRLLKLIKLNAIAQNNLHIRSMISLSLLLSMLLVFPSESLIWRGKFVN